MFTDFIKHYNIIRAVLRDVFLYGCFSREGLEGKRKLSSRKISYEIRRIQQYVEDEFIRTDRDGRYKLLALTYDSIRSTENFLVKTYMTKSFTRTDLLLYFHILMCLNALDNSACIRDIEDFLVDNALISYDDVSSKTIERKLEEMSLELGVLDREVIKRTKHYTVAKDILCDLDNKELKELLIAISLFKNIVLPVTAGYYSELTLKDYIKHERKQDVEVKDYFQYRNLHFHPVIEESILWDILKAIHEKKVISFNYNLPPVRKKGTSMEPLKPYKIRYDIQCGRFYVVSYDNKKRCVVSRLDRIEDIKTTKENYKDRGFDKLYKRDMKYSWSSVALVGEPLPERVKLQIIIDEPKENYILEKIKSEVPNGKLDRIEEGQYNLTLDVNDSGEMVPWIRSYTGYIKVLEGRNLIGRLNEDWKEMLNNYGAL